jgi:hypothetical protein
MELVRLTCCKQTIHRQCLLAYLCINSQCAYCKAMLEHASVLELPTIDRLDLILHATMATMHQTPTTAGKKRDLQSLLLDKTPLRLADTLRAESQDKKHENQRDQVKNMIKMQGKQLLCRTSQVERLLSRKIHLHRANIGIYVGIQEILSSKSNTSSSINRSEYPATGRIVKSTLTSSFKSVYKFLL